LHPDAPSEPKISVTAATSKGQGTLRCKKDAAQRFADLHFALIAFLFRIELLAMARRSAYIERVLQSRDLRILGVMMAGIAVFGVVDGSLWRVLQTPTIAYRPAILFALTLVFGWRGFVWSQLLFFLSFTAFYGWRGGVFITPLYTISHACALVVAQRLARGKPWLSGERSTLAFLAGSVLAPAVPALLYSTVLPLVGIPLHPDVPGTVDSWLRGAAGILAVAPAMLVYLSGPLKQWTALAAESEWQPTMATRNVLELALEVALWTATFCVSVQFKVRYGLNVSYLTFVPPLAFTLLRGMRLGVLALAVNAVIATTVWHQLHWEQALSATDLRLLIAIYSGTILVLATVVDERQRDRGQIQKLRTAEAALRESEERFRRVFEEGPLGLALVGKDYRFTKVNSALCEMVGYPEAELVQKTFTDITHPDDVQADLELASRLFKREIPVYRMQKRYRRKSGEFIWINLTASVIRGPGGEPLHGLAMVEDITEMRRTQDEALLRQKLESVGTLAAGIAHDFNNLLGAVQAQAELGLSALDAGSSCKEELRAISAVALRGSEIVHQLMVYAGKESEAAVSVDLSKVVDEMLLLLKASVTKHAVIDAHLDHHVAAVRASAAQLRQLVMNLITNASDAIGNRDGVIRVITRPVTLKRESGPRSSVTLPDGEYVQLEVSDTGCGMSLETQARVFDPFFTTKSAGRGLGLAVVQGIVRSLGGAIHLASEPGKGTTVQVLLPSEKTTAAGGGRMLSGDGPMAVPTRHGAVLVVDDEDLFRQGIVKMLRMSGFEVFEAAEGSSAINVLRGDGAKIDVILLDMTMPGASSHEIMAEAVKANPAIKVILTSAYSQEMIASSMSAPRVHSFIRKPFQFADLLKALRRSLSE
jgi:PAS domain S-box-containing protein